MKREYIIEIECQFPLGQKELVRCKDCDNRECDGRAGTIVCGITGDSHSRLWFCADGERKGGDGK